MAGKQQSSGDAGGNTGKDSNVGTNDSEPIDPRQLDGTGDGNGNGNFGSGSGEEFDPAIHVGPDKRNKDGSFTRKRGRRKGGSKRKSKPQASDDLKTSVDALSKTLVMVHVGLAGVSGAPELVIDKEEGDLLADASVNVLEQFDLTPDPKTQAIIGLIIACATVYGPRIAIIRSRKATERQAEEEAKATVYSADGRATGTTTYSERPTSEAKPKDNGNGTNYINLD